MGFFSKLFGKSDNNYEPTMNEELALKIINAYGVILETQVPAPGCVADIRQLPYPKKQIKRAILHALKIVNEPNMQNHLKVGYVTLASWQEGVGDENIGIDLRNVNLNDDINKRVDPLMEQGRKYEKWAPIVEAETKNLLEELKALGL